MGSYCDACAGGEDATATGLVARRNMLVLKCTPSALRIGVQSTFLSHVCRLMHKTTFGSDAGMRQHTHTCRTGQEQDAAWKQCPALKGERSHLTTNQEGTSRQYNTAGLAWMAATKPGGRRRCRVRVTRGPCRACTCSLPSSDAAANCTVPLISWTIFMSANFVSDAMKTQAARDADACIR